LEAAYPNLTYIEIATVGGVAGQDLIRNAVNACLVAFVLMLIYIGWRFDFYSGLAALTGLFHDVLIMISFMVFFSAVYQVNSSFIAAVLTVIGYSINNTIVMFDRLRENTKLGKYKSKKRIELTDISVRETLSRTINTSLTTMLTLVTLYILGVTSIREFTFPLIIGMISGIYASTMLNGQFRAFLADRDSLGGLRTLFRSKNRKAKKA